MTTYNCGIKAFDEPTTGFRDGDITLIGGINGGHKTNALLNMAKGFQERNHQVVYITLECDSLTIQTRLLCRALGVKYEDLTKKDLTDDLKRKIRDFGSNPASRVAVGSASYRCSLDMLRNVIMARILLRNFNVLMIDSLNMIESGMEPPKTSNIMAEAIKTMRILGAEYGFSTFFTVSLRGAAKVQFDRPDSLRASLDDWGGPLSASAAADNIFILRIQENRLEVDAVKLRYGQCGKKPGILRIIPEQFRLEEAAPFDTIEEPKKKVFAI